MGLLGMMRDIQEIQKGGMKERAEIRRQSAREIERMSAETEAAKEKIEEISAKRKVIVDRICDILKRDKIDKEAFEEAKKELEELDKPEYRYSGVNL
jgi:hypothetical protein